MAESKARGIFSEGRLSPATGGETRCAPFLFTACNIETIKGDGRVAFQLSVWIAGRLPQGARVHVTAGLCRVPGLSCNCFWAS